MNLDVSSQRAWNRDMCAYIRVGSTSIRTAARTRGRRTRRRTDLGNAERFVARHGADVRYLPAWKKWLLWDGKRWAVDETLASIRLAKDTVRAMYAEARDIEKPTDRAELVKHAMQSEKDAKLRAMLARVQAPSRDRDHAGAARRRSVAPLRRQRRDRSPHRQLGDHERADLITKLVPARTTRRAVRSVGGVPRRASSASDRS
jgi:hypothetical protein